MNPSLIRHILTALGVVLSFLGLGKFSGLLDYLSSQVDTIWAAVTAIIGVVTTLIGYKFKRADK